jgi:fumarate reductase flavoprotein subunit
MGSDRAQGGITRRTFFKGGAVAAIGVASAGLISGCGKNTTPQKVDKATDPKAVKWSFEIPPEPIADKDIKETVIADVVVVGAGVSGLMAALAASKEGAKTVLIEKFNTFTYRGIMNGALNSKLQKSKGIQCNKADIINDLVRTMGNSVDARFLWLWANKSYETMDYLIDMAAAEGIKVTLFEKPVEKPGYREYVTAHIFENQKKLVTMMEKNAQKQGVDIRYKMPAVQLIRKNNERITGVIAGAKGSYIKFNATKAVVLATGDYGNNDEMKKRYCPHTLEVDSNVYPSKTNTGDGHKMGLWIGAAMQQEEPHVAAIHNNTAPVLSGNPWLRVNQLGERYENEDVSVPDLCSGVQHQPDRSVWSIYDAKWTEDITKMDPGFGRIIKAAEKDTAKFNDALESGTILKADTLDELAGKMGVPAEVFKATVNRYNELARNGNDEDFGKRPNNLSTVEKAPFYAAKEVLELLITLGGFNCNLDFQVLDKERKVIPGLYAVGNVVGNRFAKDYPVHCPGLSHGYAEMSGYIAGRNAAKEKA